MAPTDYSLANRSAIESLTASQRKLVLAAIGCGAHWRVLDLWSDTSLPYEVEIHWSGGGGAGQRALITVARAVRVALYARDVRIWATNLSDAANVVAVTIADSDSAMVTQNIYESLINAPQGDAEVEVLIPPYARRLRVELADSSILSTTIIRLYDGTNTLMSEVAGADQRDGVLVGGARRLTLQDAGVGRVVFELMV